MTVLISMGTSTTVCKVKRTHALPQHHQLRFTSTRAQQDSKGHESMQADSTVKVQSIAFWPWFSPGNKTVATQESIHLVQSILKHSSGISSCRAPLTDEDKAKANKFCAAVQLQFEGMNGVEISSISPEAIGPHPMPEFELAFTKYCLKDILPWLVFNRPNDYSILVHPFTSDVVADHDSNAMWLGENLGADLQPLKDLQQQINDEVQAGKDEDALLWPFVYAEINYQSDLQ